MSRTIKKFGLGKSNMDINEAQAIIKKFDQLRGWDERWDIKDLCLNINEEIGELWHLIKWVEDEQQKKIVSEHQDEVIDFIGDMLFLVLKLANQLHVDSTRALSLTLRELEGRMPPEIMRKVKHANKYAAGHDEKQNNCS